MMIYELLNPKKEYLKGKKAFIFDMDGTLIDSMMYWRMTAGEDISKYPSQIEYLYEKYSTAITPKSSAMELLKLLKDNGIPVCIASDTPKKLAEGFFKRFDFDSIIDFYIGSDEVGVYKHNSTKIFHAAAERLGFKPEECIVVEDRLRYCKMVKAEGFCAIGVYDNESRNDRTEMMAECDDYLIELSELFK